MEKEHFEILLEDIKEKVELILEGHAALNSKIDRVEDNLEDKIGMLDAKIGSVHDRLSGRIDSLERKIDGVATDLAAHRSDTESHPKSYKVSE